MHDITLKVRNTLSIILGFPEIAIKKFTKIVCKTSVPAILRRASSMVPENANRLCERSLRNNTGIVQESHEVCIGRTYPVRMRDELNLPHFIIVQKDGNDPFSNNLEFLKMSIWPDIRQKTGHVF